jgi:hypothetical protein
MPRFANCRATCAGSCARLVEIQKAYTIQNGAQRIYQKARIIKKNNGWMKRIMRITLILANHTVDRAHFVLPCCCAKSVLVREANGGTRDGRNDSQEDAYARSRKNDRPVPSDFI